jgi:hypothetical protein
MSYTPREGSLPARAIEHLRTLDEDAELSTSALCRVLGTSSSLLITSMGAAIQHGAMRVRKEDRTSFWSLGDGTPPGDEQEGEDTEPEFNAALWTDGDLVIYGAQANTDGSVTLSREQVAHVRQLISGSPF